MTDKTTIQDILDDDLIDLLDGKKISLKDLYEKSQKKLIVAMYVHLVKLNGKVKFHDYFIKSLIGVTVFGVIAGIIAYTCF